MKLSKYISSEVIEIQRSMINPASYNPRKITDEARKLLKDNIKRLGVMGGIVWNIKTTNLVGGHQKLSVLDELQKYNPETKENDYTLRVEKVNLDPKEEKEQNIFLNNKNAQGEFDSDVLKDLLGDIDFELAGFGQDDLDLLGFEFEPLALEKSDTPSPTPSETKDSSSEAETYVMLAFDSNDSKLAFMKRFDLNPSDTVIQGEEFAEQIERIY